MRALIVSLATATALLIGASPSTAYQLDGRYIGHRKVPSCVFRYLDGHVSFSQDEVRDTIACAVKRWPVPGGVDYALAIARRESGFNWDADNPYSSASGVYQFVDGTWSAEVTRYRDLIDKQHLSTSVWNARANVLVAIRLAHGCSCWSPWGG
jgi:hypothetical protein